MCDEAFDWPGEAYTEWDQLTLYKVQQELEGTILMSAQAHGVLQPFSKRGDQRDRLIKAAGMEACEVCSVFCKVTDMHLIDTLQYCDKCAAVKREPPEEQPGIWYWNDNEETWSCSDEYPSKEEATNAGNKASTGGGFWVGKKGAKACLPQIDADSILEIAGTSLSEEYGECAEDWPMNPSDENMKLLEKYIDEAFEKWADETNNHPEFWVIDDAEYMEANPKKDEDETEDQSIDNDLNIRRKTV